jgi:hypothetical protein
MINFLDTVEKLGSGAGIISLVYLVFQNLRNRPGFKLEFQGGSGTHLEVNGIHQYRYVWDGIVKNQSFSPNAITKVFLVVWGNKNKTSALRFGFGGDIKDMSKSEVAKLPLSFLPREAKHLEITFEFPVKGTSDEHLLSQFEPETPGSSFQRPKYEYEICIEDVGENLFDHRGKQLNRLEIDLRWTLPNSVQYLQQGRLSPFLFHDFKITKARFIFRSRLFLQALGLWNK